MPKNLQSGADAYLTPKVVAWTNLEMMHSLEPIAAANVSEHQKANLSRVRRVKLSRTDRWLSDNLAIVLAGLLLSAIAATLLVMGAYSVYFPGEVLADHARWGTYGDFVGGTLGPLFGFVGLLALLLTLHLQSRELSLSVEELATSSAALVEQSNSLKLQNFERTFFELVRLHHLIVAGIDLRNDDKAVIASGRDCFRNFYDTKLRRQYDLSRSRGASGTTLEVAILAYGRFFEDYQHEIGHYVRTLYSVFKFVDDSDMVAKQQYSSIMRAQLSSFELALLFYNGLHPLGDNFRQLIERYALLENMRVDDLFSPAEHRALYASSAYGVEKQGESLDRTGASVTSPKRQG